MARVIADELWTPEELELFLREPAPPSTPDDSPSKPDSSASVSASSNSSSSSPSLYVGPDTAMDVSVSPDEMELDAAARRTRRTEIERLSRRRRQASLRAMRDEVRGLEAKFAGLLEGHATRKRISSGSDHNGPLEEDDDDDDDDASSSVVKFGDQMRRLRERFIELKLREKELHDQQKDLQRSLRDKELTAMSLQSVVLSAARTWTDPESPPPGGELEFKFHPAEEYERLMRGAYEELQTLEATTAFESLGSQCLGWSYRRTVEDTRAIFSLTKTFEGRDAEPILLESWDVFSNEARLRQSFGSWAIHVQLRVVDRPRDDIFVIHRSNIRRGCRSKGERRAHVVMLLFRVRTPDGVTLCMRSMPSLQTELEPPDHWTGIFTWIHIRESTRSDGTKSCEVTYSNYMPSPPRQRPLSSLFVAFLSTVVRWESACIAPRLLA